MMTSASPSAGRGGSAADEKLLRGSEVGSSTAEPRPLQRAAPGRRDCHAGLWRAWVPWRVLQRWRLRATGIMSVFPVVFRNARDALASEACAE